MIVIQLPRDTDKAAVKTCNILNKCVAGIEPYTPPPHEIHDIEAGAGFEDDWVAAFNVDTEEQAHDVIDWVLRCGFGFPRAYIMG